MRKKAERKESLLERLYDALNEAHGRGCLRCDSLGDRSNCHIDALLAEVRPIVEDRRSGQAVPVEVWVGHDGEDFGATSASDERDARQVMTGYFDLSRDRAQMTRATVYARLPEPARVHDGGEGEP